MKNLNYNKVKTKRKKRKLKNKWINNCRKLLTALIWIDNRLLRLTKRY